jgi:hypothetical protein
MRLVCDRCRELRGEKRKEASAGVSFSDSVSAASERKRRQRQQERDEAKRVELERQKERRDRDRRKREVSTAAFKAFKVDDGPCEMASVLLTGMMRFFRSVTTARVPAKSRRCACPCIRGAGGCEPVLSLERFQSDSASRTL